MNSLIVKFFIFPLLILNTKCLTVGQKFKSDVKWIRVGQTHKEDILRYFGKPFRQGYDSGLETYTYGYYRYSLIKEFRSKDLTIRFNNDGKVNSYTFASSFEDDK